MGISEISWDLPEILTKKMPNYFPEKLLKYFCFSNILSKIKGIPKGTVLQVFKDLPRKFLKKTKQKSKVAADWILKEIVEGIYYLIFEKNTEENEKTNSDRIL